MENNITRSQIKNIGKKLRNAKSNEILDKNDLIILQAWRGYHAPSLKYFTDILKKEATNLAIETDQITVTHRIKRIHSIILKLKRFPQMQLSTMDDIAGARIVVPSNQDVFNLINHLKERNFKHKLIKINNYIAHPKDDGYRSIHAVYQIDKIPSSIQIEIQIRSLLQHYWATGVEVFGTLSKTSFKTGEGADDWKVFFKLLSSRFAIKEQSPVLKEHEIYSTEKLNSLLISMIRKLNIIEQLYAYTSVYSSSWRENRAQGRSGRYALLTLNAKTNTTSVTLFSESKLEEALTEYSSIEKVYHSSNEINVVLVNLDNIENLEKAYPNYFMDTKILSNYLANIVLGKF